MKATLKHNKAKAFLFEGEYLDTNQEIEISLSKAMRLTRFNEIGLDAVFLKQKYDPATFKVWNKYNFVSDIDSASGWGNVSLNLLKQDGKEHDISLIGKLYQISDPLIMRQAKADIVSEGATVWHEQPKDSWVNSPFGKNIAIVPFETTRIPASWVHKINGMDALFVPCKQNITMMQDSGVTIPIELIHWGIDPDKFYPIDRLDDKIFTFGTMGALSERKGTDLLVKAFQIAFPTEKDVRLLCKTSNFGFPFAVDDKRVIVQQSPCTHEELMNDFFRKTDCFVFPTRGEGFGLTPLEAMATGLPVITTGWSGTMEYMKPEYGWILDYKMVPATAFTEKIYKEDCGDWAEPDLDHLVQCMREAYNRPEVTKQKGLSAAEYVKQEWLWKDKIKMYQDALSKHL